MPFFRKSRFPIFGRDAQSKNLSDIRFAFNIRAAVKPKADPSSLRLLGMGVEFIGVAPGDQKAISDEIQSIAKKGGKERGKKRSRRRTR